MRHVALIGILAGCAGDKAGVDSAPPTATLPDLPTATCNDMAHDWVPLEQVGGVVAWEAAPEWSLDAAGVRSLMGLAGVADTSAVQHGVRVYRVRYETQDKGRVVEASGIVAFPDAPGLTPKTALYLHPTTGLEDFCGPSGRDLIWAGVPIALAGLGYAVAAPDYLGQNGYGDEADFLHPYMAAEPTAVASLDMVRAMWAFAEGAGDPELDVSVSREGVVLGASQGGGAAFWVERYAPAYLAELQLLGMVASVPIADLTGWTEAAVEELSVATVGIPLVLAGLKDWYGEEAGLEAVAPDDEVPRLYEAIATECPSAEVPEDITAVHQVFDAEFIAAVQGGAIPEPWACMLADNSVATAPVSAGTGVPTWVVMGDADEVALPDVQTAMLADLCAAGHAVSTQVCTGLDHADTVAATLDQQLQVLGALAAGQAPPGTPCGAPVVTSCGAD